MNFWVTAAIPRDLPIRSFEWSSQLTTRAFSFPLMVLGFLFQFLGGFCSLLGLVCCLRFLKLNYFSFLILQLWQKRWCIAKRNSSWCYTFVYIKRKHWKQFFKRNSCRKGVGALRKTGSEKGRGNWGRKKRGSCSYWKPTIIKITCIKMSWEWLYIFYPYLSIVRKRSNL